MMLLHCSPGFIHSWTSGPPHEGWFTWRNHTAVWGRNDFGLKLALYNPADKSYQQRLGRYKLDEEEPGTQGYDLMAVLH